MTAKLQKYSAALNHKREQDILREDCAACASSVPPPEAAVEVEDAAAEVDVAYAPRQLGIAINKRPNLR